MEGIVQSPQRLEAKSIGAPKVYNWLLLSTSLYLSLHSFSWNKSCLDVQRSFTYSNFVSHLNLEGSSAES